MNAGWIWKHCWKVRNRRLKPKHSSFWVRFVGVILISYLRQIVCKAKYCHKWKHRSIRHKQDQTQCCTYYCWRTWHASSNSSQYSIRSLMCPDKLTSSSSRNKFMRSNCICGWHWAAWSWRLAMKTLNKWIVFRMSWWRCLKLSNLTWSYDLKHNSK